MEKQILQLKEFQGAFNVKDPKRPKMLPKNRAIFRQKLLQEEVDELKYSRNLLDVSDAIIDCMYILIGTAYEYGLSDRLVLLFDEVHRSNMTKLDSDGKAIFREDGKVMKPENYSAPKLQPILDRDFRVYKNSDLMKDIADIEKVYQAIADEQNKIFEDKIKKKIRSKLNIIDKFLEFLYHSIENRMNKRVEIKYPITAYDNVIVNVYGKDYVL